MSFRLRFCFVVSFGFLSSSHGFMLFSLVCALSSCLVRLVVRLVVSCCGWLSGHVFREVTNQCVLTELVKIFALCRHEVGGFAFRDAPVPAGGLCDEHAGPSSHADVGDTAGLWCCISGYFWVMLGIFM